MTDYENIIIPQSFMNVEMFDTVIKKLVEHESFNNSL